MTFSTEQIDALKAPLSRDSVKTRSQSGRSLSYIEGWKAIAEANRIFGFDAWTRETLDISKVAEHERPIGQSGGKGWGVTYIARVRIRVGDITRDGCGTGHGIDRDLGQAHESALKEAETDAMKRALMTFGNPFGLALYDKEQAEVEDTPRQSPQKAAQPQTAVPAQSAPTTKEPATDQDIVDGVSHWVAQQKAVIEAAVSLPDLYAWMESNCVDQTGEGTVAKPATGTVLYRLLKKAPDSFKDIVATYQGKAQALGKAQINRT